jgi:hypothetical protein
MPLPRDFTKLTSTPAAWRSDPVGSDYMRYLRLTDAEFHAILLHCPETPAIRMERESREQSAAVTGKALPWGGGVA